MSIGGHRGKFVLEHNNAPVIKFSLPRIPVVTGAITRYAEGKPGAVEEYFAEHFMPGATEAPRFDLPTGCSFEWDDHNPTEPLLSIPLTPHCDTTGIFTTDQAYHDIGNKVESFYQISYLPAADQHHRKAKEVSIPEYGIKFIWQNHTDEEAYLATIAGYEFDPRATFDLADGTLLHAVSTRFYYVVVVTAGAPDPHAPSGHEQWYPAQLTIDLNEASRLNFPTDGNRTYWDFYREDIRVGLKGVQPGATTTVRVEKVPEAQWRGGKTKHLFTLNALGQGPAAFVPLGQYLLLTAEPT
ncbi:MAG: hypothetical protein R3C14_36805 [Caldilineaceae bacterium]